MELHREIDNYCKCKQQLNEVVNRISKFRMD